MVQLRSLIETGWRDELIYDPLPVGGIAVALMLGTSALAQTSVSGPLLVAGFCGTALVYLIDRATGGSPEDAWNHPGRTEWKHRRRGWILGEGLMLLGVGGGALFFLRLETLLWTGGLLIPVVLHVLPASGRGPSLRSMGLVKPIAVAGVWAVGGALLPLVEAGIGIGPEEIALAGYRMGLILPNVLLADWGDREGDVKGGLRPWTAWGTGRGLRWTTTGLLGGAAVVACVFGRGEGRLWLWLVDAIGLFLMLGAVWTVRPRRPGHRFVLDLVVAWPLVTALAAWMGSG